MTGNTASADDDRRVPSPRRRPPRRESNCKRLINHPLAASRPRGNAEKNAVTLNYEAMLAALNALLAECAHTVAQPHALSAAYRPTSRKKWGCMGARYTCFGHQDSASPRFSGFPRMSARIDLYLEQFRSRIPGADKHTGLWSSNKSRPMCANGIYLAVCKRTKKAFGFGVNLHRFRHAAASFWSSQDLVNVRGVRDVLGHASFGTMEKHYIMSQSRLAGRALAYAIDAVRNDR